MDDVNAYIVFAKVVEAESFTGAAEVLGESKSAVSKQINRLEDSLGLRLLNRTTRRMSLTEAGQLFYERARRVAEEAEEARLALTQLQDSPRGVLRVNAPVSYAFEHLAPILPGFMAAYPDLKVDVTLMDRRTDLVEEGVDVAIRIGTLADSSLVARKLRSYRIIVAAAASYWERHGKPTRPEDLTDHNCLTYVYDSGGRFWRFKDSDGQTQDVAVKGSMTANNGEVLARAALDGAGVARLPEFICGRLIEAGDLHPVLEDFETEPVGVHAVFPHSRNLPTKVRVFIDYCVAALGPKAA